MGESWDNPKSAPAGLSVPLPFLPGQPAHPAPRVTAFDPPPMWRKIQDEIAWQDREREKLECGDDLPRLRDSSPIELVAELYEGDFSAGEIAATLAHIVRGFTPGCSAYGLLRSAWWLARIVAHLGEPEDLDLSTKLLRTAKETCREIALIWLRDRRCPCCVALRSRLETKQERK
ncbi:MAG: hypothetical protein WB460_15100 [Candidatus Acidiferrales bacterium]